MSGQRGIALLMVMFALLLLSVIGLGMMYSTNTETSINSNYRDAQAAQYAALAGLQEARDRIQPATHNIVAPTALPLTSAANIIYIINPKNGETVAPWSTSNKYFDTELCQENILALSGTAGVPCTTTASGSTWYTTVDDSQTSSSPWNLSSPLDMKWVRISLKGNNMTPNAVNGSSSTSTQVCWDGQSQLSLPAGYGTSCAPNGTVATLTLTATGTGYTSAPTVTISGGGGAGAAATANFTQVSDQMVASVTLTGAGAGYTSTPTVTISGGGGSGATATAVVSLPGAPVASLTTNTLGSQCYALSSTQNLSFAGSGGAAGNATAAGTATCVVSWSPSAHCNSLKSSTVSGVTLSGVAGASFSGTLTFDNGGHISSAQINNPGSGYTSAPTTAGGGSISGCTVTPNATIGAHLTAVNLTAGGSGYGSAPAVTVPTGVGTTATPASLTAVLGSQPGNAGQVTAINLTASGSGYTSTPTVTISGGGAPTTTATGVANLGYTYNITGLTLTSGGSGYTSNPTVSFSGGGGSGASATASISRGTNYGLVYLLTAFAQTANGGRSMMQMEVASPVLGYATTGALTLDGPSPVIGSMPNSNNFVIQGNDADSCGETADPAHPAIDGYDDPNANPATHSVNTIISSLPRPDHYTGEGPSPSVMNGYDSLGDTMGTPNGLKALIDAVEAAPGANVYSSAPGSVALGSSASPIVDYVNGDLTLSGNSTGYGVLVVTGTLSMSGNFSWHGVVLVVGNGVASFSGGGNGNIVGTMLVANIWDNYTNQNLLSSLGSPSISWNGGGGNGIQYDHCWADDLMSKIPFTPPPSTKALKILSVRALPY